MSSSAEIEEAGYIANLSEVRVSFVRALQRTAVEYEPQYREAFGRLIREFESVVPRQEIASEFGVSPATVSRWISGRTAPAPFTRRAIVERLASITEEIAKEREQATAARATPPGMRVER